ncbi:MAG: fumarylacetoacetate hydrolase family protein [Desulfamplus sp.]|nr:fumarylacetoacetate hydrolase family protein [Desulfamplus sp.]
MRIIRFLDSENNLLTGCVETSEIKKDSIESASVINGNIFDDFKVTDKVTKIKTIVAPINPVAILCIGLNYKMHAKETGMALPEHPVLFMKNPAAVTGPYSDIEIPTSCLDPLQVDYEVELAVIIGKSGKNIKQKDALDYVLGYTCANDISARRWQKHSGGGQWVRGKSFDTFCPLGPAIVTKDEIEPQNLNLECRLNSEVMQQGSTSDMIFSVPELISRLSESMTLLAGTVILTGTPSGVGFTRVPPIFLKPGDLVKSSINGIGEMVNGVVAEKVD